MLNILTTENEIPAPAEEVRTAEPGDYEIVLGRRQIAGVLFVATVALVTFSSIAYLAGKSLAPRKTVITMPFAIPVRVPGPPQPVTVELPQVKATADAAAPAPVPSGLALFADPQPNATYLQVGAVDRGVALVMAEGLRKNGLPSFVAPGPSEKIFRVLIGPLPDTATYRNIKDKVDAIGLSAFAKKYIINAH